MRTISKIVHARVKINNYRYNTNFVNKHISLRNNDEIKMLETSNSNGLNQLVEESIGKINKHTIPEFNETYATPCA